MYLARTLTFRKLYYTLKGIPTSQIRSESTHTKPLFPPPTPLPPPFSSARRRTISSSLSSPTEKAEGYLLWTDASSKGHGGYCLPMSKEIKGGALHSPHSAAITGGPSLEYSRPWTWPESLHDINYLEMAAILYGLRLWRSQFRGKEVFAFCDNASAVRRLGGIDKPGDTVALLHEIAQLRAQFNIKLFLQWIPRQANRKADSLSRLR